MTQSLNRISRRNILLSAVALAACSPAATSLAAPDHFAVSPWRKIADADWKKRLPAAS